MRNHAARPSFCRWLLLVAAVALPSTAGSRAVVQGDDGQKQVLVLYATRRDAQIAIVGERDLPRLLDQRVRGRLDHYSEYLDINRFPDPVHQKSFLDFLKVKYAGKRFDLVIAMHRRALELVDQARDDLFADTPVVFFADSSPTVRPPNSTGIFARFDFASSLELATVLQPDLKHVFVVTGAGDEAFDRLAREQFKRFEPRLEMVSLSGLATKTLEQRLSALPPHSIVYYVLVNRDGAGDAFHPVEYVDRLAAVANAPVYSWVDSTMDHGIVGGRLKSQKNEIEAIAHLAVRVLNGEPADGIPISSPDLSVAQVDWRQLRRWGISEARLPSDAVLLFRQASLWDQHRAYIVGGAAILIAESALIVGLLVQRVRRRKAEADARGRRVELAASTERVRDLGARLLDAQESERRHIARELHDDISQQVALLTIDLERLGHGAAGEEVQLATTAVTRASGIAKSLHDLSHKLYPAKLRLIGLVAALRGLQRETTGPDTSISFTHDEDLPAVPADLTLCVFRVVQESLQNALKYSRARQVSVHLGAVPEGISVSIADNGVGFDVDAAWGRGLGLISMRERVEAVGGNLTIRSAPGSGTRVEITAPLRVVADHGSVAV